MEKKEGKTKGAPVEPSRGEKGWEGGSAPLIEVRGRPLK